MKIAILHDWLTGFRGGERLLEAICELYPDAEIYTLIHKPGSCGKIIESKKIHTSFLNKIPGIHENYRKFLPLMPFAAMLLKVKEDCDLVISVSHCVIKGVKKPKGSKHLCYINTPIRYMYDQFETYFGKTAKFHHRIVAHLIRPFIIWWDKSVNKEVDFFLPNSAYIAKRVHKHYGAVKSRVVHPFVDLKDFDQIKPVSKENYYLIVSAFAPNKRIDLAIKALNLLKRPLKIIGTGDKNEVERLKSLAGDTIEFLGNLSRKEVIDYYTKARGFLLPGVEDFGITPLEAMMSGTAVIAFKEGGPLETVTSKTGVFFDHPSAKSLVNAIEKFENIEFKFSDLQEQALNFSKQKFQDQIAFYSEKVMRL
jgi:glycosyltransferase involved in cell wall biosynthesis